MTDNEIKEIDQHLEGIAALVQHLRAEVAWMANKNADYVPEAGADARFPGKKIQRFRDMTEAQKFLRH